MVFLAPRVHFNSTREKNSSAPSKCLGVFINQRYIPYGLDNGHCVADFSQTTMTSYASRSLEYGK